MSLGLIGYKLGMTQVFTENGMVEPVTVLELGPCLAFGCDRVTKPGEQFLEHFCRELLRWHYT